MSKWFENTSMVGKLWFNGKLSWDTKEKINDYLWDHKEDKNVMDEIHDKLTYMLNNLDRVHAINF